MTGTAVKFVAAAADAPSAEQSAASDRGALFQRRPVGGRVHFTPSKRPNPVGKAVHILYGDERGGNHLHEFGGRSPAQVMAMIDETLARPHSIERTSSHYIFRLLVDGVPVEALVAARTQAPSLRTAYAAWDQIKAIQAGRRHQSLRWGPWPK
jgi:hypothetical protein